MGKNVQTFYILLLLIAISTLPLFGKNKNIIIKDLDLKFIHIPAGEFFMGLSDKEKKKLIRKIGKKNFKRFNSDEIPYHKVYLDEYWIAETEISIEQFKKFLNETNYKTDAERIGNAYIWQNNKWGKTKGANWKKPGFKQNNNHPVVCISWNDSVSFCNWLSKKTGYTIKLPTEAQWEKAASGGKNSIYSWGNTQPNKKRANFADNEFYKKYKQPWADRRVSDGYSATAPIDDFDAGKSIYGIINMTGNVWEWCRDTYSKNYYSVSPKRNPEGPSGKGVYKVMRGGSWADSIETLRRSKRFRFTELFRADIVGFRPIILIKKDNEE